MELAPDELDTLCRRFSLLVEEQVVAAPMVPGAEALLQALDGQTPMFIISGTPQEELARIVDRRGLTRHFTGVFGSPAEKPPIIRDILARYRLAAGACVFIGDAMTDYIAAEACDVPFIGRVADGSPDPFPAGTRIVPDLTDLPELVA
jgi:phosphoglycolate phosphatase-like HAD superfamily hydrolase